MHHNIVLSGFIIFIRSDTCIFLLLQLLYCCIFSVRAQVTPARGGLVRPPAGRETHAVPDHPGRNQPQIHRPELQPCLTHTGCGSCWQDYPGLSGNTDQSYGGGSSQDDSHRPATCADCDSHGPAMCADCDIIDII